MREDPIMDEAARLIYQAGEKRLGPSRSREESLQRARAAQDPRVAPIRHGLYLADGVGLICDRCAVRGDCPLHQPGQRCPLEADYVAARRRQIATVLRDDGQDPQLYAALIDSAIWAEVRVARAVRYLDRHGEFRDGDYSGVAVAFPALQRALNSALDALNLTPAARAKLEAQRAAASQGVHPYASMADPLDAEFVAADEAADGDLTPQPPSPSGADGAPSGEGGCECGRGDGSDE